MKALYKCFDRKLIIDIENPVIKFIESLCSNLDELFPKIMYKIGWLSIFQYYITVISHMEKGKSGLYV